MSRTIRGFQPSTVVGLVASGVVVLVAAVRVVSGGLSGAEGGLLSVVVAAAAFLVAVGNDETSTTRVVYTLLLVGFSVVFVLATTRLSTRPALLPDQMAALTTFAVAPVVPLFVYVYAVLGGLGYVFTKMKTKDTDKWELSQWTVRIVATLPVAVGTYLLAGLVLPETAFDPALVPGTEGGVGGNGGPVGNETVSGNATAGGDETATGNGTAGGDGPGDSIVVERARDGPRRILAGLAFVSGLFVDTAYGRLNDVAERLFGGDGNEQNGGNGNGDGEKGQDGSDEKGGEENGNPDDTPAEQ